MINTNSGVMFDVRAFDRTPLQDTINTKLNNKPLIFFCREVERAIGLENILTNYHICCIEDSAIVDQLIAKNISVFCLERNGEILEQRTSSNLFSHPKTQEWLKKIAPNGFYAQTFLSTKPMEFKIQNASGTLLQVSYDLNQRFENKLNQVKFFAENNVKTPEVELVEIKDQTFNQFFDKYNKFVLQTEKSHTGSGTFIIDNEEEFLKAIADLKGNTVKISKFVNGIALTVNGCVTKDRIYVGSLQYQITGIKELNANAGSTVGNDFSYAYQFVDDKVLKQIENEVIKIGEAIKKENYKGLFGIDLILKDNQIYVIEINARQTANIPFQTKLELRQNITPMSLISLAEFLEIYDEEIEYKNLQKIEGSQIFLRSPKDDLRITHEPKSGIYRLQSDNAAIDWNKLDTKDHVIFIDEEQDLPMIFQNEGYNVEDISEGGFNLQFQRKDSVRNKLDEMARMQFVNSIISDGKVAPWILQAMSAIENYIS